MSIIIGLIAGFALGLYYKKLCKHKYRLIHKSEDLYVWHCLSCGDLTISNYELRDRVD